MMGDGYGVKVTKVVESTDHQGAATLEVALEPTADDEKGLFHVRFTQTDDGQFKHSSRGMRGASSRPLMAAAVWVASEYLRRKDGITLVFGPISGSASEFGGEPQFTVAESVMGEKLHISHGRDDSGLCGVDLFSIADGAFHHPTQVAEFIGQHHRAACKNCMGTFQSRWGDDDE